MSVEGACSNFNFPCGVNWSSKAVSKIAIAIGLITAMGAMFIFLAAYNVLPAETNLISDLGLTGKIMGGALLTLAAVVGIVAAAHLICKKQAGNGTSGPPRVEDNPQHSDEIIENAPIVSDPTMFTIVDDWVDEERLYKHRTTIAGKRERLCNAIKRCYQNLNASLTKDNSFWADSTQIRIVLEEWRADVPVGTEEYEKRTKVGERIIQFYDLEKGMEPIEIAEEIADSTASVIPKRLRTLLKEWVEDADDKEREARVKAATKIRRCHHRKWIEDMDESLFLANLTTLPDIFNYLEHVNGLMFIQCSLKIWPESIGNLTKLKVLSFKRCSSLEEAYGLIFKLQTLEKLEINNCELTNVPDSIASLNNLRELSLIENKIEALPATLANLTNLVYLNLHNNLLNETPAFISNYISLKVLTIDNNQIKSLPDELFDLPSLVSVWANNNPFSPETVTHIYQRVNSSNETRQKKIDCRVSSEKTANDS